MDFVLSLFEIAAKSTIKVVVTALAKYVVLRIKERTAPIDSRDGSDNK